MELKANLRTINLTRHWRHTHSSASKNNTRKTERYSELGEALWLEKKTKEGGESCL